MAIEQEFDGLYREFSRAGGNLSHSDNYSQLRLRTADAVEWFRIPSMVEANHNRLPGWFSSGMWDFMQLRDLHTLPDSMWLQGWRFTHDRGVWKLSINEIQQLVYDTGTGTLSIYNYSSNSTTETDVFPAKSIFHAQKIFEENGWFSGEDVVESLDIRDFKVK